MKIVDGLPQCSETISGKFLWNKNDPINGIDVPTWRQLSYNIDCGSEEECTNYCRSSLNAEFINGKKGKKCYAYEVK